MHSIIEVSVAGIIVAIPNDKRMATYLLAFLNNIQKKLKDKYEIKLLINYFNSKESFDFYIEKESNIKTNYDLVAFNNFLNIIFQCEDKNDAFFLINKMNIQNITGDE